MVRHRFIYFFKRDVRHTPIDKDNPWIERGSATAPYGNCYCDAHLYEPGSRNEPSVFQDLYRFPPSTILKIDRKFSFPGPRRREEYVTNNWIATSEGMFALNKHATRYADDKQGLPSQKFHQTFALFMKAFEDKGFPTKFLEEEEEDSQLTTLYWDFIQNT